MYHLYHPPISQEALRWTLTYESGQPMKLRTDHWQLAHNSIGGNGLSLLFSVGNWPWFLGTFESDDNQWHHKNRTDGFGLYPASRVRATTMDLTGWQRRTRQDAHSSFDQK
jgi:hypothetical protein